jgi:hypothetical protein
MVGRWNVLLLLMQSEAGAFSNITFSYNKPKSLRTLGKI